MEGDQTEQDFEKAYVWLGAAMNGIYEVENDKSDQGNRLRDIKSSIYTIRKQMTDKQIKHADKQLNSCIKSDFQSCE